MFVCLSVCLVRPAVSAVDRSSSPVENIRKLLVEPVRPPISQKNTRKMPPKKLTTPVEPVNTDLANKSTVIVNPLLSLPRRPHEINKGEGIQGKPVYRHARLTTRLGL
ncbi:hypothetical protein LY78DRAFT_390976 [Colletotrichum sublineola]|nr:hypothetical protein LY78DRAFT_390976 [Colletotrichum sublineola]